MKHWGGSGWGMDWYDGRVRDILLLMVWESSEIGEQLQLSSTDVSEIEGICGGTLGLCKYCSSYIRPSSSQCFNYIDDTVPFSLGFRHLHQELTVIVNHGPLIDKAIE